RPGGAETSLGGAGTTPRHEKDAPQIVSGLYQGFTSGSPICILFANADTKSEDYDEFRAMPRPGHADFTAGLKYGGFSDMRGSGHFSGRLTVGLVAAGVVAKKLLGKVFFNTSIVAAVGQRNVAPAVAAATRDGDSVGAVAETRVSALPAGLGEPFFDSCESTIAHILFSIPGIRGVEFGDGFAAAAMRGSEHNDPFIDKDGSTSKNGAGGINGGISNGNELVVRVAFKPTSSISKPQETYDFSQQRMTTLCIHGRHDACIALRGAVVVENATAIALAELFLAAQAGTPALARPTGAYHDA
ncbi:MAG: chorismate synthase, partial [Spirochaetaceae bacterium]|nr:chorismate synthase [Spirochaetaceae bacterium]